VITVLRGRKKGRVNSFVPGAEISGLRKSPFQGVCREKKRNRKESVVA